MRTGRPRTPVKDRLLALIKVSGECWIYTGVKSKDGYGQIGVGRTTTVRAHRAAYQEFIGPIPAGVLVCHKCDTPLCIRPEHLFLGSPLDNAADMMAKGRKRVLAGVHHPLAKLTDEQVAEIRARRSAGEKLSAIACAFNISFQHVSALSRGVFRAHS